jgi:2'-5' RNA ligase
VRLFVAVWPPAEVLDAIGALDRPDVPGVRWTTPDQWHVTLRFLGDVADELVAPLGACLPGGPARVATMGPVTARLGRSILMAPVGGLDELAGAVLAATAPLVPLTELRPYRGHLTLARARRGAWIPSTAAGTPLAGSWPVRRLSLVRSELHPSGARYSEVAGVDLAEGA